MISGVGIDMIEVARISTSLSKGGAFRDLVFSPKEIAYCETKRYPAEHYAARFAAKEAFFKALGTGWANGTAFNEVEIFNDEAGKPGLLLLGETAGLMTSMNITKIHVSLSHLKTMASAVVIIERP